MAIIKKHIFKLLAIIVAVQAFAWIALAFGHEAGKTMHKQIEYTGTIQPQSTDQEIDFQTLCTLQPPRIVKRLCLNQGEQEFVTQDGQQHTFHKNAASVRCCDAGKIWEVTENGAKVADAATFYFDRNGVLLDICQPLFWKSGCIRFKHIECEQLNYCEKK